MVALTRAQHQFFEEEGYVVVKDVLNPEEVLDPVIREYADVLDRLHATEKVLGIEIAGEAMLLDSYAIADALLPGTRICFTGTAQDAAGRVVERWEMEDLAGLLRRDLGFSDRLAVSAVGTGTGS